MRKSALAAAAACAGIATILSATSAEAATRPRIQLDGQGTYSLDNRGRAVISGTVTGRPFGGAYAATLAAADGSLPEPGVCEPGRASMRVRALSYAHLSLSAAGTVCGEFLQEPFVVTHAFTGRYDVTCTSRPGLRGTDGFLEVRLATEGRASVFAIDT